MYSVSTYNLLFTFISWLLIILYSYSQSKRLRNSKITYRSFFVITLLFGVFACCGWDYLSYMRLYDFNYDSDTPLHLEDIYFNIIKAMPNSYYLWRAFVWGGASYLLIRIFKSLKYPPALSLFVFSAMSMPMFLGARQSLAFALMLLGLVYIYKESAKIKFNCLIIGTIIIAVSTMFHKSMYAYVPILILSAIPKFRNKYFFICSLIAFPFLNLIVGELIGLFVNTFANSDTSVESTMMYLESDFRVESNLWGKIRNLITTLPVYLLLFAVFRDVYVRKKYILSPLMHTLFIMSYILIYISWLLSGKEISAFLSGRFFDTSFYPLTIFAIGAYLQNHRIRIYKWSMYLFAFATAFELLYNVYSGGFTINV